MALWSPCPCQYLLSSSILVIAIRTSGKRYPILICISMVVMLNIFPYTWWPFYVYFSEIATPSLLLLKSACFPVWCHLHSLYILFTNCLLGSHKFLLSVFCSMFSNTVEGLVRYLRGHLATWFNPQVPHGRKRKATHKCCFLIFTCMPWHEYMCVCSCVHPPTHPHPHSHETVHK